MPIAIPDLSPVPDGEKNAFNDPRPSSGFWKTRCSGCRADVRLSVSHYPHGQAAVKFCAVCGARLDLNEVTLKGFRRTPPCP